MDYSQYFTSVFTEHAAVLERTQSAVEEPFAALLSHCISAIRSGNKIMFFGNGGSAADAQHLATELAVQYLEKRAPIAAIALTTDTSLLTAAGNDFGFEEIFARQVQALGRPGDVAIGISTSGRSPNVLQALKVAKDQSMIAAGFSGGDGGDMKEIADPLLIVPSKATPRIQEMHILIGHLLCAALERELGLISSDRPIV